MKEAMSLPSVISQSMENRGGSASDASQADTQLEGHPATPNSCNCHHWESRTADWPRSIL